jgi:hypothetical protein
MTPQPFSSSFSLQRSLNGPNKIQRRISIKKRTVNKSLLVTVLKQNFRKEYERLKKEKEQQKIKEKKAQATKQWLRKYLKARMDQIDQQ